MVTISFLSFLLVILAIGYGVGYWLLTEADKQDRRWMMILGSVFGWALIALALLITMFGLFDESGINRHRGYPMSPMMENIQHPAPPMMQQQAPIPHSCGANKDDDHLEDDKDMDKDEDLEKK